jgi:myo-inositol-1(or 4)-monophosphatase
MNRNPLDTTTNESAAVDLADVISRALPFAKSLALEAGALLRSYQESGFAIQHKGTVDLVTDADKASETLIAGRICEVWPDHRLIGEEGARGSEASDDAPFGWIVDPLDGTTNFAHRYPHFAVSICLEHLGEPVVGVVYDPMKDELFAAAQGLGATLNDRPLKVSATTSLQQALLATGFSYDIAERSESSALWTTFNNGTQGLRRAGAAALDISYVAAGRLDGYFERPVNAWDIGAGVVLVREAGGTVTSLEGDPFDLSRREIVAANPLLIDQIHRLVAVTLDAMHYFELEGEEPGHDRGGDHSGRLR